MIVHLLVNASALNSPASFQANVYNIHKFGALLPMLEWTFIFIPILFHAIVGVAIVAGAIPNTHQYGYESNYRYTLQRVTGIIAFLFIGIHVFHMHGWLHNESWLKNIVEPFGGGQFRPYNATSTAGMALQSIAIVVIYVVGLLSCTFHLANGIWTMGITWGVWTSPHAQRRALIVCGVFGVLLSIVGLGALYGLRAAVNTPEKLQALQEEEASMLKHRLEAGDIGEDEHKVSKPTAPEDEQAAATEQAP